MPKTKIVSGKAAGSMRKGKKGKGKMQVGKKFGK